MRYIVTGQVTVSCHTYVEAASPAEAIALAKAYAHRVTTSSAEQFEPDEPVFFLEEADGVAMKLEAEEDPEEEENG